MRNGKPSPRVMLPLTSNFEPLSVRKRVTSVEVMHVCAWFSAILLTPSFLVPQ
ncbi:Uncharacterised protein [Vibrio cholerae]|nr:Uncharacterised protein [Vibrio cholerae]